MFSVALASIALSGVSMQKPNFIPCVQAWTFNRFTAEQAITMTKQAGSAAIELFPGQALSKDHGDTKVGPEMGDEKTEVLKGFLAKTGVKAVAFGVTGISKDPNEARKLFRWAKSMGIQVINTESAEAIDTIELMVREFDIKVGFHDHPKRANDPSYRMWDPNYVLSLVKDRDKRIGGCADTGHWVRSGLKPVDALKILHGRVVSSHLKDLHVFDMSGHDVPFGQGVSNVRGILESFAKMGMSGPVSVEYEHNWDTNLAEVAQCVGFLRAFQTLKS